jgi:hypothetical protein
MKYQKALSFISCILLIACNNKRDPIMGTWHLSEITEPDHVTTIGTKLNKSIRNGKYKETFFFGKPGFCKITYRNEKSADTSCGEYSSSDNSMYILRSKSTIAYGIEHELVEVKKDALEIHRVLNGSELIFVFMRE